MLKQARGRMTLGLAGIGSRKEFELTLDRMSNIAARQGTACSLLLVEIDYFPQYCASRGLSASDECLDTLVETLVDTARRVDALTFVSGPGRFAVVLPETGALEAERIAEEIRFQAQALVIDHPRSPVSRSVTVSVGIATAQPGERLAPVQILRKAEAALARACQLGHNQVVHSALSLAAMS